MYLNPVYLFVSVSRESPLNNCFFAEKILELDSSRCISADAISFKICSFGEQLKCIPNFGLTNCSRFSNLLNSR